mmetsp:Transcript_15240/g.23719  ORF Transcript_15240/g.23719 Transcript_15240/m.23719 type:complete len:224 (+) Transcript_15240:27-698(+)|eukprot:CAMPEP_0195290518 /NCGR_PEP_ID=MMETSP0707-20130614/6349_1 /TAXON_ID=33640 /ORGANISM="Asterionellopsis glacialis, Strain CCMP134" /LENGTH=223 /DNA_ID=CAMNT_0040350657 /DNA_START=24 /DNA_END=695 /DNA_ORIENTATION=+
MSSTVVYVVRHAEREDYSKSNWMAEYPYLHSSDPPLADKGFRQAKATAQRFLDDELLRPLPGVIITSPYIRCVQTANEIATVLDVSIWVEPGFSEVQNGGTYPPHFLKIDELKKRYPRIDESYKPIISRDALSSEWGDDDCANRTANVVAKLLQNNVSGMPILFLGHGASCYGMVQAVSSKRRNNGFYQGLATITQFSSTLDTLLKGCSSHLKCDLGTNLRAY